VATPTPPPPPPRSRDAGAALSRKPERKRPKAKRNKRRVVVTADQMPKQKYLRNGRTRVYDMNITEDDHTQHKQSRSQREFSALLSAARNPSSARASHKRGQARQRGDLVVKPGETSRQFLARAREHTRKQVLVIARRDNKQRIKKRAYYERREQRMKIRKHNKRAQHGDSDVEEVSDTERATTVPGVTLSQLPLYWQHIVRNNGRPLSGNKRRRPEHHDVVNFGDHVQQPPKLPSISIRHSKRTS
ncbi:unnamed protein product, partial [Agarophyton chilense]